MKRFIAVSATTMLCALGLVGPGASSADAVKYLGGVSVERYCQNTVGLGGDWHARLLDKRNAYSWRCYNSKKNLQSNVNMNYACKIQYPRYYSKAYAKPRSKADAYSWRCYA